MPSSLSARPLRSANPFTTTRDIAAGELLVVEKAFSIAYHSPTAKRMVIALDLKKGVFNKTTQVHLVTQIIARLLHHPSELARINSLYAGHRTPRTAPSSRAPALSTLTT